mmetsp:Transcript_13793/g.29049  ORF Transcript_13793/g.29049 Transcript_13793/m.29049 type:complete len:517 (-) Transcript_13793:91-1641(-)
MESSTNELSSSTAKSSHYGDSSPLGAHCRSTHDEPSQRRGHGHSHSHNQISETEEQEHFQQVCRSYQQYATFHQTKEQGIQHRTYQLLLKSPYGDVSRNVNTPTIRSILPPALQPQSSGNAQYEKQQQLFYEATIRNQFFLDSILKYSGVETSQQVLRSVRSKNSHGNSGNNLSSIEWVTEEQISKVDSVLKSVARDWSDEGKVERGVVYDRIVDALEKYLPLSNGNDTNISDGNAAIKNDLNGPPRVAVPGSGLGRLAWEIFTRGYSTQGSDFSLPMLLASDFILNGSQDDNNGNFRRFAISPWLAETRNVMSFAHRIRPVFVPDVDPNSASRNMEQHRSYPPEFTMLAGEFLSVYSHYLPENQSCQQGCQSSKFHAVACSFFLDTAPSLPHYLLTIYHMLEDGGLLINFGPLMYHWSGHGTLLPSDMSPNTDANVRSNNHMSEKYQKRNAYLDSRYLSNIDYTWEEVRHMIIQCGFEILDEDTHISAPYTSDVEAMMKVFYDCVFLVAKKKVSA